MALSDGLSLPEEGPIAVFRPPAETDLAGLSAERCHVIQDFKPLVDAWSDRGFQTLNAPQGRYAAAIVCLPRAKSEARALVAEACEVSDGMVVVDGQKTDGVESVLREMRERVTLHGPVSKAHGKLFWIDAAATDFFTDWVQTPAQTDGGFWTAPGVFSADAVDLASAMLVDVLPDTLGAEVVDLGAGWGFLAAHALTRNKVEAVHLVEASHTALDCARHNVTDSRAKFHWADATTWEPPHRMDTVVMNPPFHRGRASEPQIGQAFVAAAARLLQPLGSLWMVANRHLPYETELKERFEHVDEIGGDARFKLFHATGPLTPRFPRKGK